MVEMDDEFDLSYFSAKVAWIKIIPGRRYSGRKLGIGIAVTVTLISRAYLLVIVRADPRNNGDCHRYSTH